MATGFDPEAEQEVDFARYGRMLARRWWLVAVGVVAGAVIGFVSSLGGTKVFTATATLYLGQPYNPSATAPVVNVQTNPSFVGQIAHSQAVDAKVATQCGTSVGAFRNGISVQKSASVGAAKGLGAQVSPLVTVTVQASKGKVAVCVANGLARAAVGPLGTYPEAKIKNLEARIATDNQTIQNINDVIADPNVSISEKYFQQSRLATPQVDLQTSTGLLIFAKTIELPRVTVLAASRQVTASSPRNTVVIATLIGLILGLIAALLWDRVVPRLVARNGS